MHYIIIIIVIIGIVIWQYTIFRDTIEKISFFRTCFPENQNKFLLVQDDAKIFVLGIKAQHENYILNLIITSINKYLINNKGAVSDFHLMKDIVDRNCDAKEEEINTQIPVPLYLGLVGTMLGILIGVLFLVFSGGLNDLLNSGNGSGADGVEALLSGVALAMISSISGISLTTIGSYITKNAKAEIEKNKNTFLSWMQAELLPNISNNTSSALVQMTHNLSNFNDSFALNTKDLRKTLTNVNDSYQKQEDLMQAINQLKIGDIATANIDVYDKLKNSTNEIGVFAQYLQNANEYLKTIQGLNQKLDDYEKRTQVIENAGIFFAKNEKWLAENFDIANLEVNAALERFKENTEKSLIKLHESFNGQILNFDSAMQRQQEKLQESLKITTAIVSESFIKTQETFEKAVLDQQQSLQGKLQETSKLIEELKNLTSIKNTMSNLEKATLEQNGKLDKLVEVIEKVIKKQEKTVTSDETSKISLIELFKSKWIITISVIASISLIALILVILGIL